MRIITLITASGLVFLWAQLALTNWRAGLIILVIVGVSYIIAVRRKIVAWLRRWLNIYP